MKKKNNEGLGTLFSHEFRETARRLKRKEPELEAVVDKPVNRPKRKRVKDHTESTVAKPDEIRPAHREELIKLIEAAVDRKLQELLDDLVALSPGPGRKVKGESRTVKFTISMPESLHKELQKLGGSVSSHITAAVRLYLRARQKPKSDS